MPAASTSLRTALLLGGVAIAAAGCGGAGGSSGVYTLSSSAAIDGTLETDGSVQTGGVALRVGDNDLLQPGVVVHSFLSFDLAGLPAGTLTHATLGVRINNHVGDPQPTHGPMLLDDVDVGTALDAGDPSQVFASAFTTLEDGGSAAHKLVNVTARVAAARAAGRTRFQLRLRYTLPGDNDGVSDWVNYISADSSMPELRPFLQVTIAP